jgi:hypothetical protein
MLIPGKLIPSCPRHDGLQPPLRIACCLWLALSAKSPSRPIHFSSEVAHG